MLLETNFRGHILQVVESLDYGDAVSNHVISLGIILKEMGFNTSIYSKWHHPNVQTLRSNLEELNPTDEDVVILHFSGYSVYAFPILQDFRCTKVCLYHNITPHTFFQPDTDLYNYCLTGRQQLPEVVHNVHYCWGVSNYNLAELIDLGASPDNCSLVPIIVAKQTDSTTLQETLARETGSWLFLGRIAANKGHIKLLKLFARMRADDADIAQKLYLVGNFNPEEPYFQELKQQIEQLELVDHVIVTGKILNHEVQDYLARASVYVSMSEHEGFGVPLIEAAYHNLPVVALRSSAVSETLGEGAWLANSEDELLQLIKEILGDESRYRRTIEAQKRNALRFTPEAVNKHLMDALQKILPTRFRFKTVSVVICTYNRNDLLERCLDYLQYQTNQNFEVVVVNGPSTDNTEEILQKYQHRVKIGRNPKRNLSISRNKGIELADGDLIAFIDDDAIPFDDWVDTLLREFSQRPLTHAAIGGPAYYAGTLKFQSEDIGINDLAVAKVDIDSAEIGKDGWERSMLGTNTCYRADIIREVCGFDEQFDYFLDESELSFRLQKKNYIVGYAPDLFLRHEFAQSDNRGGKHKFNWFSICKNTAYYIAAYSGLKDKELSEYITQRINAERIAPLKNGLREGELSQSECDEHIEAIRSGVMQGLADAEFFPQTHELKPMLGLFKAFTIAAAYPLIGCNLEPLHICIISKEFPPFMPSGGVGALYYHLASELLLMGHHVTIIALDDFKSIYRQGRFSIRFIPTNSVCADSFDTPSFINNTNWSISAFQSLAELHAEQPVDVVDSALWNSEALALSLLPKEQRPPLVLRLVTPIVLHALINRWSMPENEIALLSTAEKTLISHADVIVPISESIADVIEAEHTIKRDARWIKSYCGIAYWASFDAWKNYSELSLINGQPLAVPKEAKLILFLGRLETGKGIDLLLEAASEFLSSDQQAHLVLAGNNAEGWAYSTRTNFTRGVANRVHFIGEVDDSTRDKLYHAAYCVVYPSRYESFGLVPLEAFVHGTPVIASNAGAIPEVVVDEECGLLFETENSAALASCVSRLLSEPQLRERLAEGARKQIRRFSSRTSAIDTIKLYANLLSKKNPPSAFKQHVKASKTAAERKSRSFSYMGSHPMLLTQCGQRVGKHLETKGLEGFLLFGPYIDLPVGRYKVNIFGQVKNAGTPTAYAEVVINSGNDILAMHLLGETSEATQFESLEFNLELPTQLEVRIWVAANADISIHRLIILSEQDFGVSDNILTEYKKTERLEGQANLVKQLENVVCRAVVIVSSDYPPNHGGGIATFHKDLAEALAAEGNFVHVITQGIDNNRVDFENGVFIHRVIIREIERSPAAIERNIPQHIWNWSATALEETLRIASHRPIDVVEAPIWDCEGAAFLVGGYWPLVTSLHTTLHFYMESHPEHKSDHAWMSSFGQPMLALETELMTSSNAVRANSRAIIQGIESGYGFVFDRNRTLVIPHGLAERLAQKHPAENDRLEILFVGRLEPRKGIDVLLAAIPRVYEQAPYVRFRIVGDDTLLGSDGRTFKAKFLLDYANENWLGSVKFEGRVDDDTLQDAYARCNIFVAPSRFESFGLVFLEAMREGKPVIGCTAGGMPEVVSGEINGLLVEPGNAGALTEAILRLVQDAPLRAKMGEAGREVFQQKFTSARMAKQSMELYGLSENSFGKTKNGMIAKRLSAGIIAHSSSYAGSDPKLQTQCGQREGEGITTTGVQGYLFYGPYVDLPTGIYKTNLYGQIQHTGTPCAFVELVVNSGADILKRKLLRESEINTLLQSIDFSLDTPAQLEVRVWVAANADISIKRLVILSEQDFCIFT